MVKAEALPKVFLFAGPEGAGKTTQAEFLAKKLTIPYIGAGDMFRDVAQNDKGELGEVVRETLGQHKYIDSHVAKDVFKQRLEQEDVQIAGGVVFDTGLRTTDEVRAFPEILNETLGVKQNETTVVYVRAPIWECVRRLLKRGRNDDTEEGIISRLTQYHKDLGKRMSVAKKQWEFRQISTYKKTQAEVSDDLITSIGLSL